MENSEVEEEQKEAPTVIKNLEKYGAVTYQVGLISEMFKHVTLQAYFNFFKNKAEPIAEDKIWLLLVQIAEVLAFCQKKGVQHHDVRPSNIFIREDHKTIALSYFGKAKFKDIFNKDSVRFLAPKLYAQAEEVTQQEIQRHYKDDVYSLGLTLMDTCLLGGEVSLSVYADLHGLNKDVTGEKLSNLLS